MRKEEELLAQRLGALDEAGDVPRASGSPTIGPGATEDDAGAAAAAAAADPRARRGRDPASRPRQPRRTGWPSSAPSATRSPRTTRCSSRAELEAAEAARADAEAAVAAADEAAFAAAAEPGTRRGTAERAAARGRGRGQQAPGARRRPSSTGSARRYEDEDRLRGDIERRIREAERLLARGHRRDPEDARSAARPRTTPSSRSRRSSELVQRRLGLLGRVNLLATGEFEALQERHDFMAPRARRRAQGPSRPARGRSRRSTRRSPRRSTPPTATWRSQFERLIAELFPGGEGRLVLTDPAQPLTSGIEIEASPGRKRVKRISLLSGGERSLTALAFLFAIFTARPSPFYLMDEVEPALDDVNLHRFLRLVDGFAQGVAGPDRHAPEAHHGDRRHDVRRLAEQGRHHEGRVPAAGEPTRGGRGRRADRPERERTPPRRRDPQPSADEEPVRTVVPASMLASPSASAAVRGPPCRRSRRARLLCVVGGSCSPRSRRTAATRAPHAPCEAQPPRARGAFRAERPRAPGSGHCSRQRGRRDAWRELEDLLIKADVGPRAPPTSWRGCGRDTRRAPIRRSCCGRRCSRSSAPTTSCTSVPTALGVILVVGVNGVGQDDHDRQARASARRPRASGEPGRERHVPRGRGRAARGLGASGPARTSSRSSAAPTPARWPSTPSPSATARGSDVLIVDTAGRLHTKQPVDGRAREGQARDREGGRRRSTRPSSSWTRRPGRTGSHRPARSRRPST